MINFSFAAVRVLYGLPAPTTRACSDARTGAAHPNHTSWLDWLFVVSVSTRLEVCRVKRVAETSWFCTGRS